MQNTNTPSFAKMRTLEGNLCHVPRFRDFLLGLWRSRYDDHIIHPETEETYKALMGEIAQVALDEIDYEDSTH